jgi:radical SAM superfamily enzyme with C-terminal helix-hairpin-helix motif
MLKVSIIDGYIDEPTCLGVPPYISPLPRYIAGSVWNNDRSSRVFYITIDQIRSNNSFINFLSKSDIIIFIAGVSVPGKYLSGFPASYNEIINLVNTVKKPLKILCGPAARYGFSRSGGKKPVELDKYKELFDIILKGDPEIFLSKFVSNNKDIDTLNTSELRKNPDTIRNIAIVGANVVTQHPFFPYHLITEIETYRGCSRSIVGGCSFCSESIKGSPKFRPIKDIIDEIQALYSKGIRHIRLGNQPCIFSYMAKNAESMEFPRPNPEAVEKLFNGINKTAPDLKTFHIDNANPGIISRYPDECRRIGKTIIKYHTSGDVAAFGVESVDPIVIKKNNLKATKEEVLEAITLLNKIGSKIGINGMPELLPGLNFVFGLDGETRKTFDLNFEFLKKILKRKLLIRRINIRQIIPIPGTKMQNIGNKFVYKNKNEFHRFKRRVKEEIEKPLLNKLIPKETILKDVYTEKHRGKLTYSRQIGSYPILIGIPGQFELHKKLDVKVIDHGYRSITAVPFPLDINNAQRVTIESLPFIGNKRTLRLLVKRPFKNKKELLLSLDDQEVGKNLMKYITLK